MPPDGVDIQQQPLSGLEPGSLRLRTLLATPPVFTSLHFLGGVIACNGERQDDMNGVSKIDAAWINISVILQCYWEPALVGCKASSGKILYLILK